MALNRPGIEWRVSVDGIDMSDRLNPYLIAIEVEEKDGTTGDTARITMDDKDGQIKLPRGKGAVAVEFEGVNVFNGFIDEIRSTMARGQGRLLVVSAKGFDSHGKVKSPLDFHKDDATFEAFIQDAGSRSGISRILIDPSFASIRRDYWSADRESFVHLGERLANEFGATFKIQGDAAVFASRDTGMTPSGKALKTIDVVYGRNLMSWDISPYLARPPSKKVRVEWLNRKRAKWEEKVVTVEPDGASSSIGDEDDDTTDSALYSADDEDGAETKAKGKKKKAVRESGNGKLTILLEPQARVEAKVQLTGLRPGVDGEYLISNVKHTYTRAQGSETELEIKKPSTKKDARSVSSKKGVGLISEEEARQHVYGTDAAKGIYTE